MAWPKALKQARAIIFCQGRSDSKGMLLDVENKGQVFTPNPIVQKMLGLRRRHGSVLEPAVGDGAFMPWLGKDAVGVEIDAGLTSDPRVLHCDFFAYPARHKFDTIIGNPPYVRHQDILEQTRGLLDMALFDRRSNLYLFFIAKCLDHLKPGGELIFITPRDFLKATAARKLNRRLYDEGSITHFYDLGDAQVFAGATPNCAIWRWEKGRVGRKAKTGGTFSFQDGQLWFGNSGGQRLGDYFAIKVGAVSGADRIFANERRGCTDFVCSTTAQDGRTRKMIYNRRDESLQRHKRFLLSRRIRNFDESNWWEWGRKHHVLEGERIYVNCKTRNKEPFFVSDVPAYDGSVLALFPKAGVDVAKAEARLNRINWEELGFVCDGRFLFTQRSLENAPVGLV